jgi:hypothetical protein
MNVVCKKCHYWKPEKEFAERSDRPGSRRGVCRECRNKNQKNRYEKYKQDSFFLYKNTRAKSRAASLGVPFDLTPEFLESIWTDYCPITGKLMSPQANRSDEAAPELDRIVPEKGYTKGNVAFISRKMNRIKNNVSIQELELLLKWMKSL